MIYLLKAIRITDIELSMLAVAFMLGLVILICATCFDYNDNVFKD